MKTKYLDLSIDRERIRFESSQGDTVILDCWVMNGFETVGVKVRERDAIPLTKSGKYRFFGKWSKYFDKKHRTWAQQWQAFTYCLLSDGPLVCELMDFLEGRRFPRDLAVTLIADHGKDAIDRVRKNPYMLMQYPRCGFRLCDALYLDLGYPPGKLRRQTYCATYELATIGDGSTWHHESRVQYVVADSIHGAEPNLPKAIKLGIRGNMLAVMRTDGEDGPLDFDGDTAWIASRVECDREIEVARILHDSLTEPNPWPDAADISFGLGGVSDHQRDQVCNALAGSIGIFCGGGGTGKTHTLGSLIKFLLEGHSEHDIALCAPTGKAAVRMSEAMAEHGVPIRAKTLHSLLGYTPNGWTHHEYNPLPHKFVFVDEASMVDLAMIHQLLRARSIGTGILFIGDPGQLPPVGSGAPLRDMLRFLPVGELTEVRRNSGQIVAAGNQIRNGERFDVCDSLDVENGENLVFLRTKDAKAAITRIVSELQAAEIAGFDPVWDVQVLAAVNRKSELSTSELNTLLQNRLNPGESEGFRVGDKVMNTTNAWLSLAKNHCDNVSDDATVNVSGEAYVANGELGEVLEIHAKHMVVRMQDPHRIVTAPTWEVDPESSDEPGSKFVLAYAITVHKSQGAQWPVVIGVIDDYAGARRLMDRSMLYTLISRAKKFCVLVGSRDVADAAVRKSSIWKRKTFLLERFEENKRKELVSQ